MLKQFKKSIPEVSLGSDQSSVENNTLFEKFFRCSQDPLCIGGIDGYFKKVNQAFADLLGYTPEELCTTPYIEFIHPDDRQSSLHASAQVEGGNNLREFENRYRCRNGEVKWLRWSTTILEGEGLVMAIVHDVTKKKKDEEELQQKTVALNNAHKELNAAIERYHVFVQQSSEIIWRCELQTPIDIRESATIQLDKLFQGYLAECNDQMAHFYGYKKTADIVGRQVADFFDPKEPVTRQVVSDFIQQGYKLHRRLSMHIDHEGNNRYFLNNLVGVVEDGRLLRVWTTQNEITQLRLAHQDRKVAEEKIRFQVQAMQDVSEGIVSTDLYFTVISFNKAAENIYGMPSDAIIGKHFDDCIDLSYTGHTWEDILKILHEQGSWKGQAWYNREDGRRMYLQCSLSFVKNERGKRIGFAGIFRDITEARQAEEALRISEERYRSVVHALGEGIVIHDKNGEIIACNRSAETILGQPGAALIGQMASGNDSICIYEDGKPFPTEQHPSLITLKTGRSLQNVVMGLQRTDGALTWISMNTEPVYYTQQRVHADAVVASFVDITQKKAAEIELQHSQQQLKEYSERITNILAGITDGFIAVDKHSHIFMWNHAVERITGMEARNVIGSTIEKIFPNFAGTDEYRQYIDAIQKGTAVNFEHYVPAFKRWLETSVYPFSQGGFIYFRDITERKKQEQLLELEKEVLKINAQPAASLKNAVDYFLEGLERVFPDMLCSVLVPGAEKNTIRHLSAPSLPVEFAQMINNAQIGPKAGSCGTAMWRKEMVLTIDTTTDPLWEDYQHVCGKFGLRSCWSFPILDAQENILATIAIYHRYPKAPSERELNILDRVGNLLRVIIENKNAETRIRVSNERYVLVTKATNDAIWDWDVHTNSLYWGEGIYTLFGYKPGYVDNSLRFWEANIYEYDRDRVINGLNEFINDNNTHIWEAEYRFKKANGEYALVYDRGFLIFDHTGKITRMVGSMQDITEKKEMERQLLKQEIDKQKLVAQAVVNAQEKERAEIGKELHDNVNQILSTAKLYLELAQTDDESRVDLILRSADNISDAINEIRSISRSLVPPSVGDLGLIDSVQDLVENIKATKKLHVEFYFEGSVDSLLDEKRKLMLFRIIQEQVNNVLKHAMAHNLVIELIAEADGRSVDLTISDDGKGFEPDKVRSKKGVGLSNITSRAQLFNGTVHIVTAIGEGCKLKINVPISNI